MDGDQLGALRRQVEENYALDISAIDWLQRRYPGASSASPGRDSSDSVPLSARSSPSKLSEIEPRIEPSSPASPAFARVDQRNDNLGDSIRAMFGAGSK